MFPAIVLGGYIFVLGSFIQVWHGVIKRSVAGVYERFLVERVVPNYESVLGLRKVIFTKMG